MTEIEFYVRLGSVLPPSTGASIGPDTDLIGGGLVDSASMIDVLLLIEELTGTELDPDALDVALFERAERLYGAFFSSSAGEIG